MSDTVFVAPINPIPFNGGALQPLPNGRSVWRFDPQEGEPAEHLGRVVQTLRDLGHTVVVGDQSVLAVAVMGALNL